jgi:UDP-3-O-[3-hydroxymyristoyl] glucosamine N-acyltransferase
VIAHSGVVIGADGFGIASDEGRWIKIPQIGRVLVGDDVEIGANTTIDRGAIDDTVIEEGVKLDNQIQVGHNVRIGAHTAIAGCAAIAGSADIGRHCTIGGAAVILGHLKLVDHVNISAGTVISRSILKAGTYTGMFPFDDNESWSRNTAVVRHLAELLERVRALERAQRALAPQAKEKKNG